MYFFMKYSVKTKFIRNWITFGLVLIIITSFSSWYDDFLTLSVSFLVNTKTLKPGFVLGVILYLVIQG
jgi:hypothetical protein